MSPICRLLPNCESRKASSLLTEGAVFPPVRLMEDALVETAPRALKARSTGIEELYRSDGDRLWRAVLAFAGDREVASDAVAEAFAQAIRRGRAIRDPQKWVWRAAFRIAAGDLGRRRRGLPDGGQQSYEMETSHGENLLSALSKLPPKWGRLMVELPDLAPVSMTMPDLLAIPIRRGSHFPTVGMVPSSHLFDRICQNNAHGHCKHVGQLFPRAWVDRL